MLFSFDGNLWNAITYILLVRLIRDVIRVVQFLLSVKCKLIHVASCFFQFS